MNIPSDIDKLMQRHTLGTITREEMVQLEAWLREDPSHIAWFASYGLIEQGLMTIGRESTATDLMGALAEIDAAAPTVELVDLTEELKGRRLRKLRAQQASAQRTGQATEGPVVLSKLAVVLAMAASLGLIAWLGWPDTPPTTDRTAQQPNKNVDTAPDPEPSVAFIRRSVDARWSGQPLSRLHTLLDGQVVTLRAGLAEVVFDDGASVVVQGPATFVPTGTNGMRLDTGRIVATVPPAAIGFTVDTPTARIIDYGTEFGVDADGDRQTQVLVFRGEVRATARVEGVVVGQSVPLLQEQAATIGAGGVPVARVAFDATGFERRVVKRLDLVDIVAGGDGTGSARVRAINPVTGEATTTPILDFDVAHMNSPGRYTPVPSNPLIDGVFIPHRRDAVQTDSTGRTVDGLRVSDPRSYQLIWAGGLMPSPASEDALMDSVRRAYPNAPEDSPVLYMISNKGITIDLDAVRESVGGGGELRLTAQIENIDSDTATSSRLVADVLCYLDGELVESFIGVRHGGTRLDLSVVADTGQRLLTLVVADAGDGLSHDWIVFHQPVLEVLLEAREPDTAP